MDVHIHYLDITSLRAISLIQAKIHFSKLYLYFSPECFPTELIHLTINAIQSKATTPGDQALGNLTRINLNRLTMWNEWGKREINKINKMHDLGMFSKPIDAPKNEIVLQSHWKYPIKINGTLKAIQFCDGYKRASPILIELTLDYSSCAEHPVQILFLDIFSNLDFRIYGGEAYHSFAHIPGPFVPTFVYVDEQFSDWYRHKSGNNIDR